MILHTSSPARAAIFAAVEKERLRQNALVEARVLPFNCATPRITPALKLAVLGEEFGEVAKAVCETSLDNSRPKENLRAELIQVAACAVAWLESLNSEP